MCQVYILADRFLDKVTKNATMTLIWGMYEYKDSHRCYQYPDANAIRTVYRGTMSNSPLRRLILYYWLGPIQNLRDCLEGTPEKFKTDLLIKIHETGQRDASGLGPLSGYPGAE